MIASSGRVTHARSSAWRKTGTPPKARLHSATPVKKCGWETAIAARPPRRSICGDRVVVDEADAVPQHIAGRGLDQVGLLADGEVRLGGESGQTGLDRLDGVAVLAAELGEGGPALALMSDVLALVLADRAARRRLGVAANWAPQVTQM